MKFKWFTSKWEQNFLKCELGLSFLITGLIIWVVYHYDFYPQILGYLDGVRLSLYATTSQVAGALLGFVIAGVSILLTMNKSPAMELLEKSPHFRTIYDVFTSSAKYCALTTLISLLALFIDKDQAPRLQVTYLVLWAIIISSMRMWRCLWILKRVIELQIGKNNKS